LAAWRKGRVGASGGLEEFVVDPRQVHAVQRNNQEPNGAPRSRSGLLPVNPIAKQPATTTA